MDRKRRLMENNNGWPLRSQLFDGAPFRLPLLSTAVPASAATGTTATFTRATAKTWPNNDGYLVTGLAGEIGFPGARRVYNQVSTKSADNTVGSTINSNVTAATTTLTFTAANNAYWYKNSNGNAIVGRKYVCSATVSSTVARTVCFRALATSGTNSDVQNVALTTASQRIELTFTADIVGVILFGVENRAAYATDTSTTGVITFTDVQLEDVTAQTTQTAGEYVSVGVESAPYYHGSFVDGVKCFPTDLSGNPIPSTTLLGYQAQGARTNLCLQSNAFDNASWTKAAVSVVADQYTAPDGATTADKVLVSAGNAQHYIYLTPLSITAATYSVSFYCKYINHRWIAIDLVDSVGHLYASFDLLNGVTGAVSGGVTSSIESVGNGFYRISWTAARALRADATVYLIFNNSNTASFETWNAVGTEAVGVWGAQVELGSFASSYIATTTTAVTRNADILTYTGGDVPNLKTLCATFKRESGVSVGAYVASLSDGTAANKVDFLLNSATAFFFQGTVSSVDQWNQAASNAYTPATNSKAVMTWATNSIKMAKDGTAQTEDTTATVPSVTQLQVGHLNGASQLSGNVGGIYGWTRNLSQSELNAVTAL